MHRCPGFRQWVARSVPALLLAAGALVVTADVAVAQDDPRPIGIVDTGTPGPVTAIRLADDGSAIVTAPAALRPDGPWTLTVVLAGVDRRDIRTVVALDGDEMSARGEQVGAATGARVALGERAVSAASPDELSVEVPGIEGDPKGVVWVVTESEATGVVVTPMFGTDDLAAARVPLRVGGVGWVTAGDDPSSWYWASGDRGPRVSVANGILTIGRHANPIEEMDGREVDQIIDRVILRAGDEAPGAAPPLIGLRMDPGDGSVQATLADGSSLADVPTSPSRSESLGWNQEGIDIDLAALAASTGAEFDGSTLVGLTRELTLVDGSTIEFDGVELPVSALGTLGDGFADRVADAGSAPGSSPDRGSTDVAAGPASGGEAGDVDLYAATGIAVGLLGAALLAAWAAWRGLRSEALAAWRADRRRHKERDRVLRARRKADQSPPP